MDFSAFKGATCFKSFQYTINLTCVLDIFYDSLLFSLSSHIIVIRSWGSQQRLYVFTFKNSRGSPVIWHCTLTTDRFKKGIESKS